MLLIHPPVAKPSEAPAGIARLAGVLERHAIPCTLLDAGLEGLLWLLQQPLTASDTWTRRAVMHAAGNCAALRDPLTYRSPARYSRAVRDINRLLAMASAPSGLTVTIADCRHPERSPLCSNDLLRAAEHPEENPFYPYFAERLTGLLEGDRLRHPAATSPFVGISLTYLSQALCAFAMIGFLKRRFPGCIIVLGGGLATSWMQRPGWRNPFTGLVDHMIAGPGEGPLLDLLGVSPKSGSAPPAYHQLPLTDYLSPGTVIPYSASSGCYWSRCAFCPEQAEGNLYQPRPVTAVREDLRELTTRHTPALLHFLDNAISPALLRSLAAQPPGAPWYGFARFGLELADPDFCHALRRSGCVMLKLGLESGDQAVLDRLSKGIDLTLASRILLNLHATGIGTYIYLLFGTPAETEAEARQTMNFVVRHQAAITFLNLALFNMPLTVDNPWDCETVPFSDGDLSLYTDFRHPAGWGRGRVRTFLRSDFRRHPAIASIVANDPPLFTSNHAPFFCGQ